MSHIGKEPIKLPNNVKFFKENENIVFQGKEGTLTKALTFFLDINENNHILL